MNSLNRIFVVALGTALLFVAPACKELSDILDDFDEEAPGFCKEQCQLQMECEGDYYEDHYTGNYADDAISDMEDACVRQCALPCATGVYVTEDDYDDDDWETEFKDHISGNTYKSFAKCMWEANKDYYDCDDDDWFLDYEEVDEDWCLAINDCYATLDLGWECEWEEDDDYDYEYCECDFNDEALSSIM